LKVIKRRKLTIENVNERERGEILEKERGRKLCEVSKQASSPISNGGYTK
jgi:hypothetical protein